MSGIKNGERPESPPHGDTRSGHPLFYQLSEEEQKLHARKNRDYAYGGDPLGNFKRVSDILKVWGFDISPALVALIYLLKQEDAAVWMLAQGHETATGEGIPERLTDVSVYAKLMHILVVDPERADSVSSHGGVIRWRCPACFCCWSLDTTGHTLNPLFGCVSLGGCCKEGLKVGGSDD